MNSRSLCVALGQRKRRHALLGPPLLDDRQDLLAVLIDQHELRSQKIGSAQLSATRVGAVTGEAGDAEQIAAALDDRGVRRRPLHRRKDAALSAALPGPAGAARRRLRLLACWRGLRGRCLCVPAAVTAMVKPPAQSQSDRFSCTSIPSFELADVQALEPHPACPPACSCSAIAPSEIFGAGSV